MKSDMILNLRTKLLEIRSIVKSEATDLIDMVDSLSNEIEALREPTKEDWTGLAVSILRFFDLASNKYRVQITQGDRVQRTPCNPFEVAASELVLRAGNLTQVYRVKGEKNEGLIMEPKGLPY